MKLAQDLVSSSWDTYPCTAPTFSCAWCCFWISIGIYAVLLLLLLLFSDLNYNSAVNYLFHCGHYWDYLTLLSIHTPADGHCHMLLHYPVGWCTFNDKIPATARTVQQFRSWIFISLSLSTIREITETDCALGAVSSLGNANGRPTTDDFVMLVLLHCIFNIEERIIQFYCYLTCQPGC